MSGSTLGRPEEMNCSMAIWAVASLEIRIDGIVMKYLKTSSDFKFYMVSHIPCLINWNMFV